MGCEKQNIQVLPKMHDIKKQDPLRAVKHSKERGWVGYTVSNNEFSMKRLKI